MLYPNWDFVSKTFDGALNYFLFRREYDYHEFFSNCVQLATKLATSVEMEGQRPDKPEKNFQFLKHQSVTRQQMIRELSRANLTYQPHGCVILCTHMKAIKLSGTDGNGQANAAQLSTCIFKPEDVGKKGTPQAICGTPNCVIPRHVKMQMGKEYIKRAKCKKFRRCVCNQETPCIFEDGK